MSRNKILAIVFAVALIVVAMPARTFAEDNGGSNSGSSSSSSSKSESHTSEAETENSTSKKSEVENETSRARTTSEDSSGERVNAGALQTRCTAIEQRVDERVNHYDQSYQNQVERYKTLVINIGKAVTRLKELGVDVSKLEADLKTANDMLLAWNQTRTQFVAAMQTSRTLVCGSSDGAFRAQIEASLKLLKQMREQAVALHQFMLQTVKADIQALKDQIKSSRSATSTSSASI